MSEDRIIANRFKIEVMLGQGGMGTVYRGVDTQTGQTVAIKSLKTDIIAEDPSILQRFEREGEALRLLNHPNIVKMLSAIEDNGQHYLVMEYIGGGSLLDLLKQEEQLSVQRVLEIALDLADALTRAHRLKIIHRDLKPANVMLTEDGTPKLTDFGVAQMGNFTRMTQSGALVGTYAYLSPEILEGQQLDARTDIWAFGIMLYEMLTGHRPFEAEQTAALLSSILAKPVPPMNNYRDDIPMEVENLILRMLEKDRDERVNSIRLVGAQIEALLSGDTSQINDLRMQASLPSFEALPSERFGTPTPTSTMQTLDPQGDALPSSKPPHNSPLTQEPMPSSKPPHVSPLSEVATAGVRVPDDTIPPRSKSTRKLNPLLMGVALVALLIVIVIGGLVLSGAGSTQTGAVATVAPVAAGEYMVLVAEIEHIGSGDERDVQRFIADNLRQVLEVNVPFSNLRVREYSAIVRSNEEALAAAETNGASVIVWGSYDAAGVTLEIQLGSFAAFPHIDFERSLLERTANVQIQLTNERQERITQYVIGVLIGLQNADGNIYQILRALAVLDAVQGTPATIVGDSVSAQYHRLIQIYLTDPEQALVEINAAIQQDTSNPFLYSTRSLLNLTRGTEYLDDVERDIVTIDRLASESSWLIPPITRAAVAELRANWEEALTLWTQIVEARPDQWFPLNYRASVRYVLRDFEGARADFERVFEMQPDTNFPYMTSTVLALRDGRINDARQHMNTILTEFPDPSFGIRIANAVFGSTPNVFGYSFNAFGNFLLGQYDETISYAEQAAAVLPTFADPYLLQGLAYCNLGQYAEADEAYTAALEVDDSFALIYGLRGQVRQAAGNLVGALQDLQVAQEANLGEEFNALVAQAMSGEVDCTNFFD